MLSTEPPSYRDVQEAQTIRKDLKTGFANIVNDHQDALELFNSVNAHLVHNPHIGQDHPLSSEWGKLRTRYRTLYRGSQDNAAMCAASLESMRVIFQPLKQTNSDLPTTEKLTVVKQFGEAAKFYKDQAKNISVSFDELAKEVDTFPSKVERLMREVNASEGIWTKIKSVCSSIYGAMKRLINQLANALVTAFGELEKMRAQCLGVSIDVDVSRNPYNRLSDDHELGTLQPTRRIKDDCKSLSEKLRGFEYAWHVVDISCLQLFTNLHNAEILASSPMLYETFLAKAELIHAPLVQCLQAYAMGKVPDFY